MMSRPALLPSPLDADRARMLALTGGLWAPLRGEAVFMTGGTGFVGCWLLEALLAAEDAHGLGLAVHLLTRDAAAFTARAPHLARHGAVRLVEGDVRDCAFPTIRPALVVAGAADASAALNEADPLAMADTIVAGTRRTLDFARTAGASRVLLLSSGAVYGPQPRDMSHVAEDHPGGPLLDDPRSAYAEGKRMAELTASLYGHAYGLEVVIARCFAFIGPYLPLDRHFAAGNFLADALAGGPIRINGDGTPLRSYMHGADLAVWLWTLALKGAGGRAYNVGSEEAVSIRGLAEAVAGAGAPRPEVLVAREPEPGPPSRYVPSTARARGELGLAPGVDLASAIAGTLAWHRRPHD